MSSCFFTCLRLPVRYPRFYTRSTGFQPDSLKYIPGSLSVTGFGLARTRFRTSSNVADGNFALRQHLSWANVRAAECRAQAEPSRGDIQLSGHVTEPAELLQHYVHEPLLDGRAR